MFGEFAGGDPEPCSVLQILPESSISSMNNAEKFKYMIDIIKLNISNMKFDLPS